MEARSSDESPSIEPTSDACVDPKTPDGLEHYIQTHGAWLERFLTVMTKPDSALAADIQQEVWIRVHKAEITNSLQPADGAHSRAWLRKVAINVLRNQKRSLIRRVAKLFHYWRAQKAAESEFVPTNRNNELFTVDQIHGAVSRLPGIYREAIVLRYFEELSVVDSALALGISKSAFLQRLSRAREMLRGLLGDGE